MSAFNIGQAGLAAQAKAIEVTSKNVANASTVGYKSSEYEFVDQYFKAADSSGNGAAVADLGSRRSSSQGALTSSGSALDLAIQGKGMFVLNSETNPDNGKTYYSRSGQFSVDKTGCVVNANGLYLTGYQANTTFSAATAVVGAIKLPPSNVGALGSTKASLDLNLDGRQSAPKQQITSDGDPVARAFRPGDTTSYSSSATFNAFDASGTTHAVTVYFKKVEAITVKNPDVVAGGTVTAQQYEVYMTADGATVRLNPAATFGLAQTDDASTAATAASEVLAKNADTAAAAALIKGRMYSASVLGRDAAAAALTTLSPVRAALVLGPELASATAAQAAATTALSTAQAATPIDTAAVKAKKAALDVSNADQAQWQAKVDAANAAILSEFQAGGYASTILPADDATATGLTTAQAALAAFDPANPGTDTLQSLTDTVNSAKAALAGAIVAAAGTGPTSTKIETDVNAFTDAQLQVNSSYAAKVAADTDALTTEASYAKSVVLSNIGTLQFVGGKLLQTLNLDSSGKPTIPTDYTLALNDKFGTQQFQVSIDMAKVGAFASQTVVHSASADGYASGQLSGITVDATGLLIGQYSNGHTMVGGQLMLANFQAPESLQEASANVFVETQGSGTAVIGTATTEAFGAIRSMQLESSNIDMADELVKLMVQQRNYQANSKSIQAADTLLTTAINLGR
jgi:flagellar hook protein FlgE